ncbi:MAG: response regulator [Oligoflexus sp.]
MARVRSKFAVYRKHPGDIGLPDGMDGYEFAQRIRQDPQLKDVLLIAVTGYASKDDKAKAESVGFDAHFAKPADFDLISEIVANRS